MRKLKNFKKTDKIPPYLDNEKLIFAGFYKKYSCIVSLEEGKKFVSISAERGEVKLTEYEMQEITNNFQMGEYETWEIKSPFREGKTRYFREK